MINIIVLFFIFVVPMSWAQNQQMRATFSSLTKIENPFDLRDPFRAPLRKSEKFSDSNSPTLYRDGVFTNIPQIEEIDLKTLKIVGVMIGKDRRAIAKANGKDDIITLKEGMRIGADQAELKAILPGGVILVEKILNVYGEEEYLETVIPISR